jgi:hypothetical protein
LSLSAIPKPRRFLAQPFPELARNEMDLGNIGQGLSDIAVLRG